MTRDEYLLERTTFYVNLGDTLELARLRAIQQTIQAYPIAVYTRADYQRDRDEYTEEMSLGGMPYKSCEGL
jgi:hypothetical protein